MKTDGYCLENMCHKKKKKKPLNKSHEEHILYSKHLYSLFINFHIKNTRMLKKFINFYRLFFLLNIRE